MDNNKLGMTTGKKLSIICLIIFVIILIVVASIAIWYLVKSNPSPTSESESRMLQREGETKESSSNTNVPVSPVSPSSGSTGTTESAGSVGSNTPGTPPSTCAPISCAALNARYRNIPVNSWTDDDRNTAIWLINVTSPSLTVPYLQGLSNIVLGPILQNICDQQKNCQEMNGFYTNKPYAQWTDTDRNTAIWLLKQNGSDVGIMQSWNNQQIYPLLQRLCANANQCV